MNINKNINLLKIIKKMNINNHIYLYNNKN